MLSVGHVSSSRKRVFFRTEVKAPDLPQSDSERAHEAAAALRARESSSSRFQPISSCFQVDFELRLAIDSKSLRHRCIINSNSTEKPTRNRLFGGGGYESGSGLQLKPHVTLRKMVSGASLYLSVTGTVCLKGRMGYCFVKRGCHKNPLMW